MTAMREFARIRSITAIANACELFIRSLAGALRLVEQKTAPDVGVVATCGSDASSGAKNRSASASSSLARSCASSSLSKMRSRARAYSASIDHCALNDCNSHQCARRFQPHDNALRGLKSGCDRIGLRIVNKQNKPRTRVRRTLLVCETPNYI